MFFYDRDTIYIHIQGSTTEGGGCSYLLLINRLLRSFFLLFLRFVVAWEMRIECDDDDGGLHVQFDFHFFIDNILLNFLFFMNHT